MQNLVRYDAILHPAVENLSRVYIFLPMKVVVVWAEAIESY